nr:MAG TPA: hypothetical protein [Caudoviricetes sp.]
MYIIIVTTMHVLRIRCTKEKRRKAYEGCQK